MRPIDHWDKSPDGAGWVVELRGYTFQLDQKRFVQEVLLENLVRYGIVKNGPANNAEAPAAGAGLPDLGPVVNRVSHVLVYKYLTKKTNERSNFEIIGQSYLANAMRAGGFGEGGGAPGGMPPGMMPGGGEGGGAGAGGSSRDSWTPVGSTGSSASAGGFGRGGMGGGPGETMTGPGGAASTATTTGAKSNHTRTEFVIFFIWKEPTPSDAMRAASGEGADPGAASPADATGGGGGLTSTGPGKGAPRGVIDPTKKSINRPRGDAPGNRPPLNQPAAVPVVPPPQ